MSTLAEQVVEQLKTDMDNVYDAGYQKGLKEVGGLDVSKFGIQNEVTGTNIVTCDYVNENEHNVEVKLSSADKQVKVTDKNNNVITTYTPNADGTLEVTSISPTMNIICEGVDISAKYFCMQDVEWQKHWDNFQNLGKRTNYDNAFMWYVNDEIFKPKHDIIPTSSSKMFSCSGGESLSITELKNLYPSGAIIDFSNSKNISQLFFYNHSIKRIGVINTASTSGLDDFVNNAVNLVEIEKIILKDDGSQRFNSAFYYTVRLERITFEGVIGLSINFQWSPLLSDTSVQNIIDCLADLTGQATQTLAFHADVKAKLTEEQIATITSKNWTLA